VCADTGNIVPSGGILAVLGDEDSEVNMDLLKAVKYPKADMDSCLLLRKKMDDPTGAGPFIPYSAMRQVVTARMTRSKLSAPHFYIGTNVDMSGCMDLRKKLKKEQKKRVSYNDMIIKACGLALRKYPQVASACIDNGYIERDNMNVGFAVALDIDGLVVPVIKDVDKVSIFDVTEQARTLAEKARSNKLLPDEFSGAVMSVSNLGGFEVDSFSAIINPGESVILAVGKIVDTPVVVKGNVEVRPIMKMTLSCDHRVVDGALGARFNGAVKSFLESPEELL
jgi:pyruvate dehydrogenase E2 component (dihydrolipoamide acetyltransferase)